MNLTKIDNKINVHNVHNNNNNDNIMNNTEYDYPEYIDEDLKEVIENVKKFNCLG